MFPTEITVNYIVSQSFGLVALFIVLFSYFVKTKKKQLILSIIANIFISVSFLYLGTYFACIGIVIATVRTIIFFIYELKLKSVPVWLVSCIFLVLIFNCVLFMQTPLDLIPMISLMLYTLGFRIRRLQFMRLFFIVPTVMFLVYNVFVYAYTDALLKVLELIAIGISTSKFYVRKVRLEKKRITEELQIEGMEEFDE